MMFRAITNPSMLHFVCRLQLSRQNMRSCSLFAVVIFATFFATTATASLSNYTYYPDHRIRAYNVMNLGAMSPAACAVECDNYEWCTSFDIRQSNSDCILQDNPPSVSVESNTSYDSYAKITAGSSGDGGSSELSSISAMVIMHVDLYASISGLGSFQLSSSDIGGSANALYTAAESFTLETNGEVSVQVTGTNLENPTGQISTTYILDDNGPSFNTQPDSVHLQQHTLGIEAQLGNISDQRAGTYNSSITLTVTGVD